MRYLNIVVTASFANASSHMSLRSSEKTVEVRGRETSATLSGLLPYTPYVVKVSGRTNIGPGPVSDDLIVQTSEGGK